MTREYKKLQSVAHANTRIVHINSDLIKEIVPTATAKTILGGKWTVSELSDTNPPKKVLILEVKEFTEWV